MKGRSRGQGSLIVVMVVATLAIVFLGVLVYVNVVNSQLNQEEQALRQTYLMKQEQQLKVNAVYNPAVNKTEIYIYNTGKYDAKVIDVIWDSGSSAQGEDVVISPNSSAEIAVGATSQGEQYVIVTSLGNAYSVVSS